MQVGKRVLIWAVMAGLSLYAVAEPRTWTSIDGKKAIAEFQDLADGILVLKRGAKTLRVPLDQFSEEDQAYVQQVLADRKADRERLEQECREKVKSLQGLRRNVQINERRWADWEDYYTESVCGRKMMTFFKDERSIVDVRDKGVFVSVEDAVRPPEYAPKMITYCPSDYNGEEKLGIYIHVSAGNNAVSPNSGYQQMMEKYRLVYASPFGTGNDQADMRRCALALDALAQLRNDYSVDENRIYIGGTSGGGAISTFATFLYPEDFRAALNSVRYFVLESQSCLPFADKSDCRKAGKNQQPFAFISGPKDSNYSHMPASEKSFQESGFTVRFFDIPGMKHQMATADTFDKVMEWVEANNPRL